MSDPSENDEITKAMANGLKRLAETMKLPKDRRPALEEVLATISGLGAHPLFARDDVAPQLPVRAVGGAEWL